MILDQWDFIVGGAIQNPNGVAVMFLEQKKGINKLIQK